MSDEQALQRLDPATGKPTAKIPVRQGPCEASDVGLGSVWTATCTTPGLARIDPKINRVSAHVRLAIPLIQEGEASIGVGAGSVWLVVDGKKCDACLVARVEPKHLKVIATVPVSERCRRRPFRRRLRLGDQSGREPRREDRSGNAARRKQELEVGPRPRFFAVGEGACAGRSTKGMAA